MIGRDRELAVVKAALDTAFSGRGGAIVVVGEPGSGKSRLAEEAIAMGASGGFATVATKASEGGAGSLPWVQVLRALDRHVADPGRPPAADAVTAALLAAATRRPLLVVVDDLHAAELATVDLFETMAGRAASAAILLLGTYDEVDARRRPDVERRLAELDRAIRRIFLTGLGEADVGRFVESVTGTAPSPGMRAALHAASGGNPFLLRETADLVLAEGRLRGDPQANGGLRVPDAVRDGVRSRLRFLSDGAREVVTLAAVFGREFDAAALRAVSSAPADRVLEALGEARSAGLVVEVPGSTGRFAFRHGIVRDAVYESLPPADRLRAHRRIGQRLEHAAGFGTAPPAADLAYHFVQQARLGGDAASAAEYAGRAGERAAERRDHSEAARWFARALEALDLATPGDSARRCWILLGLGAAREGMGETAGARATFAEAAAIARADGNGADLARAALGFAGPFVTVPGVVDREAVALLEEAAAALERERGALRARVLARLALGLYFSDDPRRRDAAGREAVEVARAAGDPSALSTVLFARHMTRWAPDNLDERLAMATEARTLAEAAGEREALLSAEAMRIIDLLETGDIAAVDHGIEAHARVSEAAGEPAHLWQSNWFRAARALLEGDLAAAARFSDRALALGGAVRRTHGEGAIRLQSYMLRWHCGTSAPTELLEIADQLAAENLRVESWRCALLGIYRGLGRMAEARREFDALARASFASLPRDSTWLTSMILLAEFCAQTGDAARAAVLYELLAPYAGRNVVAAYAIACYGSASRYLGMLAATRERWDDAWRHYQDALAMNERMGARPLVAETRLAWAWSLLRHGGDEERARAQELLAKVVEAARALGMPRLGELARAATGFAARAEAAGSAAGTRNVFKRQGGSWTIGYAGRSVTLRHSRGCDYLAALLRSPGEEIHVAELARRGGGAARLDEGARRSRPPAGEALERARKAVSNRIRDSLRRIQEAHPRLGAHLERAIRTGAFCSYEPPEPTAWDA